LVLVVAYPPIFTSDKTPYSLIRSVRRPTET